MLGFCFELVVAELGEVAHYLRQVGLGHRVDRPMLVLGSFLALVECIYDTVCAVHIPSHFFQSFSDIEKNDDGCQQYDAEQTEEYHTDYFQLYISLNRHR